MDTDNIDLRGILSERNKIIKSHSRHFSALSLLFNLPFSYAVVAFPTLLHAITNDSNTIQSQTQTLLRYNLLHTQQQFIGFKTLLFCFLYYFTCLTLFLCATGTITYSFYQGFFGRPVKLVNSIKSLSNSLLRLFVTFFFAQVVILVGFVGLGMLVYGVITGIEYSGFEIDYSSIYFIVLYNIGLGILGLGLLYVLLNWILASVVVVVESSWGLEPLRRSAYLVKGMRGVGVRYLLYFGLGIWGIWWLLRHVVGDGLSGSLNDRLEGFYLVMQIVMISSYMTIFLDLGMTLNTVLYVYSKALNSEVAGEIAEEFACEYVSLSFDEEKSAHVFSVA